ncbi:MAG TPA: tetratricopeptide repeat protein, partial [candidate division Zixibacteria bacterium]|nr:tetratricopeptide repeat protein [candidate division Zixibacteria bacterium]
MKIKFTLGGLAVALILAWQTSTGQTWTELLNQADSLANAAKYDSAIIMGQIALEKVEIQFGKLDTAVALTVHKLGVFNYEKGNYAAAEDCYRQSLAIREKILGVEHPEVATSLHFMGNLYLDLGKFLEAEVVFKRALSIREKVLGAEHLDVTRTLNGLASLYQYQGKYAEAEIFYQKILSIRERVLGPQDPRVARTLNNLAALYTDVGRYAEAENFYRRAIAIQEQSLGPMHLDLPTALNNLANLCQEVLKYTEAETLYKRALYIREKGLGAEHPGAAMIMNNLAELYLVQGKYSRAESLCTSALAIRQKILGPDHPLYAASLHILANLFLYQQKYTEADSLYKVVQEILNEALGPQHPSVAENLEWHTKYYRLVGDQITGLVVAGSAFKIRRKNFLDGSYVMPEKDALTYSQFVKSSANNFFSCYLESKTHSSEDIISACDYIFSSKGQVSDEIFERRKILVTEKDSATQVLADSYRLVKFQLSGLFVQGPDPKNIEGYKSQLDSLSRLANQLETDLAYKSASFRRSLDYQNINTHRIHPLIPENATLVEYFRYVHLPIKPETAIGHYLVSILDKKSEPVILDLGEASLIDEVVVLYQKHMASVSSKTYLPTSKNTEEYKKIARRIYQLIWKPVEKYLVDKSFVLVAPDGGLNLVSFASLV